MIILNKPNPIRMIFWMGTGCKLIHFETRRVHDIGSKPAMFICFHKITFDMSGQCILADSEDMLHSKLLCRAHNGKQEYFTRIEKLFW